jgi:hypothetical protein
LHSKRVEENNATVLLPIDVTSQKILELGRSVSLDYLNPRAIRKRTLEFLKFRKTVRIARYEDVVGETVLYPKRNSRRALYVFDGSGIRVLFPRISKKVRA